MKIVEYFEEVETEQYNGYYYSVAEAISIMVLGSLCGLTVAVDGKTIRSADKMRGV